MGANLIFHMRIEIQKYIPQTDLSISKALNVAPLPTPTGSRWGWAWGSGFLAFKILPGSSGSRGQSGPLRGLCWYPVDLSVIGHLMVAR